MRTTSVTADGQRILVIVLDKGEEAVSAITEAVRRANVRGGRVTAVGGFHAAALGYFNRHRRDYDHIPVTQQVEVLSLVGDVADRDGSPVLHAHAVLGHEDGSTVGGHLLRGDVWPTLEVIISEVPAELRKRFDPQTGLALLPAEGDHPA